MGFDKTLTPGQLTPYKINGKMKIKKAQNYQWHPIQVHNFIAGTNTMLILCSIFRDKSFSKGEQESEICNKSATLQVSGKLNFIDELESGPIDSSGLF